MKEYNINNLKFDYKQLIGRMSYFNAAEGRAFRGESKARDSKRLELQAKGDELLAQGLVFEDLEAIAVSINGLFTSEDLCTHVIKNKTITGEA